MDVDLVTHYLPLFQRLEPRTLFTGGRLADTDVLTLDEAASMASRHANLAVTVGDFLRAAARGEITLHAICQRTVTMQPCREVDEPLLFPERCITRLPLEACRALSSTGQAEWRTCEGHEPLPQFGGSCAGSRAGNFPTMNRGW